MKQSLTKDQVTYTALQLMQGAVDIKAVNLRVIAKELGCSHTNLYRYFPSYAELLWEACATLREKLAETVTQKRAGMEEPGARLVFFFHAITTFYFDHPGWFRLLWHIKIAGDMPKRCADAAGESDTQLTACAAEIWWAYQNEEPDIAAVRRALHTAHCYIVGEASGHILQRGFSGGPEGGKQKVTAEAVRLFRFIMES